MPIVSVSGTSERSSSDTLQFVLAEARDMLVSGHGPVVLGLCGVQGSGKSTLAATLVDALIEDGVAAAALSLDDLYLRRDERARLADRVHPLLHTRGVPGTHDIRLGIDLIERVRRGEAVALPSFDKALDDRKIRADWPITTASLDLLVFEGWCVGARPETASALVQPVNALERDLDPDGRWRRYANRALAGRYHALFGHLDRLILLAAPGFDVVLDWRLEQEHMLRARTGIGMSDDQVAHFIEHYRRLTLHILREMPDRADLTLDLDARRRVLGVRRPAGDRIRR